MYALENRAIVSEPKSFRLLDLEATVGCQWCDAQFAPNQNGERLEISNEISMKNQFIFDEIILDL